MTNNHPVWQPTARDDEILATLNLLPLTAEQLFKWSRRFENPFTQLNDVHRRMRKLSAAGLVRRWPLAIESRGCAPHYYKLSLNGYRFLRRSVSVQPDRKRAFSPIGRALHHHTLSLSEFIVHAGVAAHRQGINFIHLYPENSYRIEVGEESLLLDWRFTLMQDDIRRTYNVELDNSTETILSTRDEESIVRKIRILEAYDSQFDCFDPQRSLTLFVTTRSRVRLAHILQAAAGMVNNPQRALILGIFLPDFLLATDPLTTACFLDQRGRATALMPCTTKRVDRSPLRNLDAVARV